MGTEFQDFFSTAMDTFAIVIGLIGAVFAVLGIIDLLDANSTDNAAGKSQGVKRLASGGGIILIAIFLIPKLSDLFTAKFGGGAGGSGGSGGSGG